MTEECPGEDKCHGCLQWCDQCGDVGCVCDDPRCDSHQREEDVLREVAKAEKEIREEARQCRDFELWLREWRHSGADTFQTAGAGKDKHTFGYHEHTRAWVLAQNILCDETALAELEEKLREIRYWAGHGCVMVPRG